MSELSDQLAFDIMSELTFGRCMGFKEPGKTPFKAIPHTLSSLWWFLILVRTTKNPITMLYDADYLARSLPITIDLDLA
jgi:hypothetical protein